MKYHITLPHALKLLVLFLVSMCAPPSLAEDPSFHDKWAIVVGVSKFKDPNFAPLTNAAKDATDFANFLVKDEGFAQDHVRLFLNESATREEISNEIADSFLPRIVRAGDLVVLYFSTHSTPAGRDLGGENFLVTYDTSSNSLFTSALDIQDVCRVVRERAFADRHARGSEHMVVIMDASHSSGGSVKDTEGRRGFVLASACAGDETAWTSKRYANGVFTHHLIEALHKGGSQTDLIKALPGIRKAVKDEVKKDRGQKQTVQWNEGTPDQSLILGAPSTNPKPVPDSVKALFPKDSWH